MSLPAARILWLACLLAVPWSATTGWAEEGSAALEPGSIPPAVVEARRLVREHRRGEATALLESLGPPNEAEPERTWLLLALFHEHHRPQDAWAAAAALPRTPFGAAVTALVAEDAASAVRRLVPYTRSGSPWVHLSLAFLHARLGGEGAVIRHARLAAQSPRDFVRAEGRLLEARAQIARGNLDAALAAARLAARVAGEDARGPVLIAEIQRRRGAFTGALEALLEAQRRAPGSEIYPRRSAQILRSDPVPDAWLGTYRASLAALDEGELERANPERLALHAWLASRLDDPQEAISAYEKALAAGALPVPTDRELRHLLFAAGNYERAHSLLRASVPPEVFTEARNLVGPSWRTLEAAIAEAPDSSASPDARLRLARALVSVGALQDALEVLADLETPEADSLRIRLEGQQAFERALRDEVEAGYRIAHRERRGPGLRTVLARVAGHARRHLVPDEAASLRAITQGLDSLSLVGEWLNHAARPRSPLVRHFRRYGKYLVMGQRDGLPVEAVLLSMASLVPDRELMTPGGRLRHDVAVGYDRSVRGYIEAQGGSLGGACLADGVWLDADSARENECEMRRDLIRDPTTIPAARAAPRLPARSRGERLSLSEAASVSVRLLARYVERHPDDRWGSFSTLLAHEAGHVYDIKRYLPSMGSFAASIGLLARNGFDPTRVEAELERRAQLNAVRHARDPDLALVEMLFGLPVEGQTDDVHAIGYAAGVARMIAVIDAGISRWPAFDPAFRLVDQFDRMPPEAIRTLARQVR